MDAAGADLFETVEVGMDGEASVVEEEEEEDDEDDKDEDEDEAKFLPSRVLWQNASCV